MTESIVKYETQADAVEALVIGGDLAKLSAEQRVVYFRRVCASLGLNPLTKPFSYIVLNNKLTMYATRDAADQLRKRDNVSIDILSRKIEGDLYTVTARASTPDGRHDECAGIVCIAKLAGSDLANACMKAETKARRRVTLSLCGLGFDDTDADDAAVGHVEYAEAEPCLADPYPSQVARPPHWADDPQNRVAFWTWAKGKGLSDNDVHTLTGCESVRDFDGDMDALEAAIEAAIAKTQTPQAVPA